MAIFGEFFSGLRLPRNEARKVLKNFGKIRSKIRGKNSGRKIRKIREIFVPVFNRILTGL